MWLEVFVWVIDDIFEWFVYYFFFVNCLGFFGSEVEVIISVLLRVWWFVGRLYVCYSEGFWSCGVFVWLLLLFLIELVFFWDRVEDRFRRRRIVGVVGKVVCVSGWGVGGVRRDGVGWGEEIWGYVCGSFGGG